MNARHEAAQTLHLLEVKKTTTRRLWDGPRDGATTALVLGSVRRRGSLDAVLQTYSTRKLQLMKPPTRAVLRVGLFEMLFLDDTPVHAIVNAAVENMRMFGRPQDGSFVNAMLRGINRAVKKVPHAEATDLRRSLPREEFSWYFPRSVFSDRNTDPVGFLAGRGSTIIRRNAAA